MKRINKRKKNNDNTFGIAVAILGLMIVILFFAGCAEPQPIIQKVNVEVPCQVDEIPVAPKDIDLKNSSIGVKAIYIQDVVKYAKEIQPIINNCVVEKKIKEKKK